MVFVLPVLVVPRRLQRVVRGRSVDRVVVGGRGWTQGVERVVRMRDEDVSIGIRRRRDLESFYCPNVYVSRNLYYQISQSPFTHNTIVSERIQIPSLKVNLSSFYKSRDCPLTSVRWCSTGHRRDPEGPKGFSLWYGVGDLSERGRGGGSGLMWVED